MSDARLIRITGAIAEAEPLGGAALYELVRVGERGLLGEVVRVDGAHARIQVYEETSGLAVGEPVRATGEALTLELGPGLLGIALDGVGRPLAALAEAEGNFMAPGARAPTLDPARRWKFSPTVQVGAKVAGGDVLGTVVERTSFVHRILVPPGVTGTVDAISGGDFTVWEPFGKLHDGTPLTLAHRWPVRRPRPIAQRLPLIGPLVTGQRVLDFLFPVAEGGTVAVPGGFGTGKTVIEQSLAKYAEADVVIYVGCGERGNEMAEVLDEFPRLIDQRTGHPVLDRTVLLVNTSNMPVAAREASVYVGITIAEYYRDMGYRVALMADSLSRWAEALREIGARLQEMPGEEGYPTYLTSRLGRFFERAGRCTALGSPERQGSLTVISAISPPGGDFSEPVTEASLRVTGALWALDPQLAHQRQFPAVDWEASYTLYGDETDAWFRRVAGDDWPSLRRDMINLLQRDRSIAEIAALVGVDALQDTDRIVLDIARIARDAFLGQSAFDPNDAWSPIDKTATLARLVVELHRAAERSLAAGVAFEHLDLTTAAQQLFEFRLAPAAELTSRAAAIRSAFPAAGVAA